MGWSCSLEAWSGPGHTALGAAGLASQASQQQQGHRRTEGTAGCRQLEPKVVRSESPSPINHKGLLVFLSPVHHTLGLMCGTQW